MPNTQRVYIGGLAHDARERDIEKFLKGYGKFGEVSMKQGYGFVDFEDYRDADDACHDLNGKDLLGERVRVQLAHDRRDRERNRSSRGGGGGFGGGGGGRRSPGRFGSRGGGGGGGFGGGGMRRGGGPGRKTNHRIIVDNLSSRTSWQDLKDFFRTAGDVNYCTAHKLRNGEGLVEFTERRYMETALDRLDGSELHGKRLKLTEESGMRGGRSRSRSPKRSRSPRRSKSGSRDRSPPARKAKEGSPGSRSPVARTSRSPRRSATSRSPRRTGDSRSPRRSRTPKRQDSRSPRRSRTPKRQESRSPKRAASSRSPRRAAASSRSPRRAGNSRSPRRSASPNATP